MSSEEFHRAVRDWHAAETNFNEAPPEYVEAAILTERAARLRLGRAYVDAKGEDLAPQAMQGSPTVDILC